MAEIKVNGLTAKLAVGEQVAPGVVQFDLGEGRSSCQDVCEALTDTLLEAGFEINCEVEEHDDVLAALKDAVIVDRDELVEALNCAEADLLDLMGRFDEDASSDTPAAVTVRMLHALIQRLEPNHTCQVDEQIGKCCDRCGQAWIVHNDDGSCIDDDEVGTIGEEVKDG